MKMINGQLPTWYVIKRISEDQGLYAKAPSTDDHYEAKAQQICGDPALYVKRNGRWEDFALEVTTRNDWTLYRRGKKTRKAKGGKVKLGRVVSNEDEISGNGVVVDAMFSLDGTYDIIAIPVKS